MQRLQGGVGCISGGVAYTGYVASVARHFSNFSMDCFNLNNWRQFLQLLRFSAKLQTVLIDSVLHFVDHQTAEAGGALSEAAGGAGPPLVVFSPGPVPG